MKKLLFVGLTLITVQTFAAYHPSSDAPNPQLTPQQIQSIHEAMNTPMAGMQAARSTRPAEEDSNEPRKKLRREEQK